jgi:REP element-mobilizing transposase RayT
LVGRVTPVRAVCGVAESACRGLPALPFGGCLRECVIDTICNIALPARRKLPHTIPQWVAEGSWFFITINCVPRGKNQLCRHDTGDAVLAAMKFNHERLLWHCRLCLLMPDHLHAIIAFPREPGMQTIVRNWKKFVAGKHSVNWQRDFFDHRLRDHHELEEKTSYILMNPVRKGLCERVDEWVWVYRTNDRPPSW